MYSQDFLCADPLDYSCPDKRLQSSVSKFLVNRTEFFFLIPISVLSCNFLSAQTCEDFAKLCEDGFDLGIDLRHDNLTHTLRSAICASVFRQNFYQG
jgi:hypothetical protein